MTRSPDWGSMRFMLARRPPLASWIAAFAAPLLLASSAAAVTSTRSVPSAFGGNGHNISFDGRLILARDSTGWTARVIRPEAATFLEDGLPDAMGPLVGPATLVFGDPEVLENALAICEPDPAAAPYACDDAGNASDSGPFDCYDTWIIDSDAVTPAADGGFVLRRRHMRLWVRDPRTATADIEKWELGGTEALSPTLKGIEPTVTRDGKLLVYQGHPANDGTIDILMYAVTSDACSAGGWSAPQPLSHMYVDPAIIGVYPLGDRRLRAADGTPFEDGDLFHGAYPWLMPDGDAVIFAGTPMPCRAENDPPGCGPRRNALSVVGYPTNWGIAHIDGGVNPDVDQTVRLFFSSPGPATFDNLPVTPGLDVWPFFGSNTSNYVELSFDDGLDGHYAALYHLNESVSHAGELDRTRTPDVSGYFNTGTLHGGLAFASANDGVVGKSLAFDGVDDYVEVADAQSLSPVNGLTIDFQIAPAGNPDCDGENNYRVLLQKGDLGAGSYSVVLEEGLALQFRVDVDGVQQPLAGPALADAAWTHVSFEYDGATGSAGIWYDDVQVAEATLEPGTITAGSAPLRIGAPGERVACPAGDGAFAGRLDEIAISRHARRLGVPEPTTSVGVGAGGGGPSGSGGADPSGGPSTSSPAANGAGGAASGDGGDQAIATADAGATGGGSTRIDDGAQSTETGCSCRTAGADSRRSVGAVATGLLVVALVGLRRRRG